MSVTSLCLGLDVSPRRMGWGLVDLLTGEPVTCGCEELWRSSTRKAEHEAVNWPEQAERTQAAIHRFAAFARMHEVQAVFIEHPISRFAGVAYDGGLAVGVAMAEVKRRWPWVTVQFLLPSEWRTEVGLKGNASKEDVLAFAEGFECWPMLWDFHPQDAADALVIALAGQKRNKESWDTGVARGAVSA